MPNTQSVLEHFPALGLDSGEMNVCLLKSVNEIVKEIVNPKLQFCHNLLTCMIFFLLMNTKEAQTTTSKTQNIFCFPQKK